MVAENKMFKIGDVIKVKDSAWTEYKAELMRFDFRQGQEYSVSGVYNQGSAISLAGSYSSYYSKYFELVENKVDTETKVKSKSALDKQVSGSHYKDFKIQPAEYCHANNIPFLEGNVIKYTSRHRAKNKKKDLEKAIHCLELLIELEYGNED